MKAIYKYFNKICRVYSFGELVIPKDKQLHFIWGFFICAIVGWAVNPLIGLAVSLIAGALKEIYDKASGKGTPDIYDAIATFTGGLGAYLILKGMTYV